MLRTHRLPTTPGRKHQDRQGTQLWESQTIGTNGRLDLGGDCGLLFTQMRGVYEVDDTPRSGTAIEKGRLNIPDRLEKQWRDPR